MDRRLCVFLLLLDCWSDACGHMYKKSFVISSLVDLLIQNRSDYEETNLQLSLHQDFNGVCANHSLGTYDQEHFTNSVVSFKELNHTLTYENDFVEISCVNCNKTSAVSDCIRSFYVNSHTSVIIYLIIAGMTLLCLATALDLKVSSGRFNGLIFYVATVHLNQDTFFQTKGILSLFFSWFNLDFGFSVCFYNELSSTSKLWLQFAFPLCIVLLVIVIFIVFQYSTPLYNLSVATVPISGILLVLAYMKVLRTTASILPFKTITGIGMVWIYDEHVVYFESNHLVLVIVSIMFLVFVVPTCTLLLIAPQYSYHIATDVLRESKFGLSLSSVIDMFTGRFKQHTRFWFGLILLCYTFQVVVYHLTGGNGLTNLVTTIISSCVLLYISLLLDGVYAEGFIICNKLEHFLFLNLITVSALTILRHSDNHDLLDFCVYVLIFPALLIMFNSFIERRVFPKFKKIFKATCETKAKELCSPPNFFCDQDSNTTGNSHVEDDNEITEQKRESIIFDRSSSNSSQSTADSVAAVNSYKKKITSSELFIDKNCDSNEAKLIPVDISIEYTDRIDLDGVKLHTIKYTHTSTSSSISSTRASEPNISESSEIKFNQNSKSSAKAVSKPPRYIRYKPILQRHSLTNPQVKRKSLSTDRQYSIKPHKGIFAYSTLQNTSVPLTTYD